MPKTKNASYRYRLIDQLLRKRAEGILFEELQEIISQKLYEEFDVETGVSERTLRDDFRVMRKDPPEGYGAPIVSKNKKVYYEDPDFSILNMPLTSQDLDILVDAGALLRQFKGLPFYDQMRPMITKLQSYIDRSNDETPADQLLQFDTNRRTEGLGWIDPIYQAMRNNQIIELHYQPFRYPKFSGKVHPHFLKEYQNRWFLVAKTDGDGTLYIFALDRIEHCNIKDEFFARDESLNPDSWSESIIGITHSDEFPVTKIHLHCSEEIAPYVLTKPFHTSQRLEEKYDDGSIEVSLEIKPNREFFGRIHTFLPHIRIVSPNYLSEYQRQLLKRMSDLLNN